MAIPGLGVTEMPPLRKSQPAGQGQRTIQNKLQEDFSQSREGRGGRRMITELRVFRRYFYCLKYRKNKEGKSKLPNYS